MIELVDVRKTFSSGEGPDIAAVAGVSLAIATGETLCLIGPSGCGKTTLLRMINRLEEPTSGEVRFGGEDARAMDVIRLRRRIGYVIQSGGLFPHMTVAENIGLLCTLEGWSKDRTRARVDELLDLVELAPDAYAARLPRELSGGQQQRVAVARALALDPDVVLMDEPFGALDPVLRGQLHEAFLALKERVHKTVVMVTHDMREAVKLGDRVALMRAGELVQVGRPQALLESDDDTVRAFLGEAAHA